MNRVAKNWSRRDGAEKGSDSSRLELHFWVEDLVKCKSSFEDKNDPVRQYDRFGGRLVC